MEHFFDDYRTSYGVKEILRDGLPIKYEKVDFKNYVLADIVDSLVANEMRPSEKKKCVVNHYMDRSMDIGAAPYVRFVRVATKDFNYLVYKTQEERDAYYDKFQQEDI